MKEPTKNDFPMMITFPSVKDQGHPSTSDRTACQMLIMADYEWFQLWQEEPCGSRAEE
jgi:hypothetical protein